VQFSTAAIDSGCLTGMDGVTVKVAAALAEILLVPGPEKPWDITITFAYLHLRTLVQPKARPTSF
jgi:hypothetical protein